MNRQIQMGFHMRSRTACVLITACIVCMIGRASSPATDSKMICVQFTSGRACPLAHAGNILWKTNLLVPYSRDTLYSDSGSSPVLTEKDVINAMMHHGESYLAAFDKLTGDLHWKVA